MNKVKPILTSTEFNKKYGIPLTRTFGGRLYKIAGATRHGAGKDYCDSVAEGLRINGFNCRVVKYGNEYYVYAVLKK